MRSVLVSARRPGPGPVEAPLQRRVPAVRPVLLRHHAPPPRRRTLHDVVWRRRCRRHRLHHDAAPAAVIVQVAGRPDRAVGQRALGHPQRRGDRRGDLGRRSRLRPTAAEHHHLESVRCPSVRQCFLCRRRRRFILSPGPIMSLWRR